MFLFAECSWPENVQALKIRLFLDKTMFSKNKLHILSKSGLPDHHRKMKI